MADENGLGKNPADIEQPQNEILFSGQSATVERSSTGTIVFTQKILGVLVDPETKEITFSWNEFMNETIAAFNAMTDIIKSSVEFPAILFDYNDCTFGELPLNAFQLFGPVRELISGLKNPKGQRAYIVVAGFPSDNRPLDILFTLSSTSARNLGIVSRLNKVPTREYGINELNELIAAQSEINVEEQ